MLSYNRVRVIGICPLLLALHAGSVNIDMMPDYSNSCFKEWVHGGCGWDAFISHLCLCVCVFPCCASVFATVLSGIISLRLFCALLVIKSAMDNFQSTYWGCFSNGAGAQLPVYFRVLLPLLPVISFLIRRPHRWKCGKSAGFLALLRQPLREEEDLWELHSWCAAGQVRLRLVGLNWSPCPLVFATLGSHVKAWKATAHHGRICCAA